MGTRGHGDTHTHMSTSRGKRDKGQGALDWEQKPNSRHFVPQLTVPGSWVALASCPSSLLRPPPEPKDENPLDPV